MEPVFISGSVSWNQMIYVDRLPQGGGQTVFPRAARRCAGGSGAGKALNLARLGFDVTLHGFVGEDPEGAMLRQELEAGGVKLLLDVDPVGTQRHFNVMTPSGERRGYFVQAPTYDPDFDLEALGRSFTGMKDVILGISGHCHRILPLLEGSAARVWVDVHDWDGCNAHHIPFVERADYFFMSHLAVADPDPILQSCIDRGARLAVCTFAEKGLRALDSEGRWYRLPARPVEVVVDSNGAGDAFLSGVFLGLRRGLDVEHALSVGAVCGARAVGVGTLADPSMDAEEILRTARDL